MTVNPAKRANIIDAAAHWWTNHEQSELLAELELSEKRTSDYFDDDDQSLVTAVYDSSKKPKKGILKNRKISGGDSGCALSDPKECELLLIGAQHSLHSQANTSQSSKTQSVKTVLLKQETRPSSLKRHSLSSNSSGDTLDFSYDSSSSSNTDPTSPNMLLSPEINTLTEKVNIIHMTRKSQQKTTPSMDVYSCAL